MSRMMKENFLRCEFGQNLNKRRKKSFENM